MSENMKKSTEIPERHICHYFYWVIIFFKFSNIFGTHLLISGHLATSGIPGRAFGQAFPVLDNRCWSISQHITTVKQERVWQKSSHY